MLCIVLYGLHSYGSTYPALSTESDKDGDARCAFICFITALEALVGVVYAGFTGAIIFAKVTRLTQRANARFSVPLTVTFGLGVEARLENDGNDESRDDTRKLGNNGEKAAGPSPFPVLTFRIANTMHEVLGGEILSASLNAAVIIENVRHEVSEELARKISQDRMERRRSTWDVARRKSNLSESERSTVRTTLKERISESTSENSTSHLQKLNELVYKGTSFLTNAKTKVDDEEVFGSSVPPRLTTAKLELDVSEHPLFKRVWKVNHVIDKNSPLLTAEAKRVISINNGQWPREWNNYQAVREAVRFKYLVVSFTGLSNITGGESIVFSLHVLHLRFLNPTLISGTPLSKSISIPSKGVRVCRYCRSVVCGFVCIILHYDISRILLSCRLLLTFSPNECFDIAVGYQFVNILFRDKNGAHRIDLKLLNDVTEQNGGGGEPLIVTAGD